MYDYPYAQLVGSLMYLAICTCSDISFAVGKLGQFSSNPGITHWKAAQHLLHYLQSTKGYQLTYAPDSSQTELFTGYTDTDFVEDRSTRRSTSGIVIKVGTGAASWSSKLQGIVTLSTTEAEYIAAITIGQKVIWLRYLFTELGYKFTRPSTLFLDNNSAVQVTKNPEHHGRIKHLDLRFYWLRDQVNLGAIRILHLKTDDVPADLITKALGRIKVKGFTKMIGVGDC
ncbi:hypothetical protein PNOK_0615600 [Pyrrhoderma noxium]|uniref:Uncharacterized protein n=1 Tax=Pyrrhoderma noxium TaxID=2282107 RepID=A0A286UDK8_9AGAM|nr:hypothetical protein PNOK_0615600 [Pyrrhoderma noxium]